MMNTIIRIATVLTLATVAISGCASTRATGPGGRATIERISFGGSADSIFTGIEPQSAKDLVQIAFGLSGRGKHVNAADLFVTAAGYSAPDGRFRQSCLAAAAAEFVYAGNRERFKEMMSRLRAELSEFDRLNPSPGMEILLLLDNCDEDTDITAELDRLAPQQRSLGAK